MSKAETFIKENIRDAYYYDGCEVTHISFLTPDQARRAVEIAREEMMGWLQENASKYMEKQDTMFGTIKVLNSYKLINDLKQAMKDK